MEKCEYCNHKTIFDTNKPIIKDEGEDLLIIDSSDNTINVNCYGDINYEVINYCPMCGRKLVQE